MTLHSALSPIDADKSSFTRWTFKALENTTKLEQFRKSGRVKLFVECEQSEELWLQQTDTTSVCKELNPQTWQQPAVSFWFLTVLHLSSGSGQRDSHELPTTGTLQLVVTEKENGHKASTLIIRRKTGSVRKRFPGPAEYRDVFVLWEEAVKLN